MSTENEKKVLEGGDAVKKISKGLATKIVIISLSTVLVALAGILAYILLKNEPPVEEERDLLGGRGIVATEDNIEEVFEELEKPVRDTQYFIDMSLQLKFNTWKESTRNTVVRNNANNSRTVYFELFLDDENGDPGEMIYSSPYIPLGEELRNFGLDKELAAGTYNTTMIYTLVDDNYEKVTTLALGVKVIINN